MRDDNSELVNELLNEKAKYKEILSQLTTTKKEREELSIKINYMEKEIADSKQMSSSSTGQLQDEIIRLCEEKAKQDELVKSLTKDIDDLRNAKHSGERELLNLRREQDRSDDEIDRLKERIDKMEKDMEEKEYSLKTAEKARDRAIADKEAAEAEAEAAKSKSGGDSDGSEEGKKFSTDDVSGIIQDIYGQSKGFFLTEDDISAIEDENQRSVMMKTAKLCLSRLREVLKQISTEKL